MERKNENQFRVREVAAMQRNQENRIMKKGGPKPSKEIEDLKAKIAFLEFQLSALMKEVGDSKTVRYSTSNYEL